MRIKISIHVISQYMTFLFVLIRFTEIVAASALNDICISRNSFVYRKMHLS